MKIQFFNGRRIVLPVLILTAWSVCAQNTQERTEIASIDAEAQRFFEAPLNKPGMIERIRAVTLNNELQPEETGRDANFFCNPLLLNGKSLDYADFTGRTKGILTLVEGDPESPEAKKVPFRIYLRRDGVIITEGRSDSSREVMEIEISEVLAHAKHGDHLLIVPVRKSDWKAKRILRVLDGC